MCLGRTSCNLFNDWYKIALCLLLFSSSVFEIGSLLKSFNCGILNILRFCCFSNLFVSGKFCVRLEKVSLSNFSTVLIPLLIMVGLLCMSWGSTQSCFGKFIEGVYSIWDGTTSHSFWGHFKVIFVKEFHSFPK